MATIIVGHKGADMDCLVSMLGLATAIREIEGYKGQPRFEFIPQGETYRGVRVNPKHRYEKVGGDWIWHVDCGLGLFDHHRPGCTAPSSAVIIDGVFKLSEKFPEWEWVVRWATEADRGKTRTGVMEEMGGCDLPAIIRGLQHSFGPGHDYKIFRLVETIIEGLLVNQKIRVAAADVPIEEVSELVAPEPGSDPLLRVMETPSFGKVGLIVGPEKLGGSFRNRMEQEANCRLMISFGTNEGKTAIMSRFARSGKSPVDLRKVGIVGAIQQAEVAQGGSATVWFAHEVDGRVANLFNGSAKVDLKEEDRTRLSPESIIQIVKDCITVSSVRN